MEHARPASPRDTARLIELGDEALAEMSARRGGSQLARTVLDGRSVPDVIEAALGGDGALLVAGELGGVVLGFGLARVSRHGDTATAVIEVLYVEPDARCVGLGEAIMNVVVDWASSSGCTGVDAVALPGSREAKSFFETHGLVTRALLMHIPIGRDRLT